MAGTLDPATTRARRTWRRQFVRLYVVAFVVTLIPFGFALGVPAMEARNLARAIAERTETARTALLHGELETAIGTATTVLDADPSSERAQAIRVNALFERFWATKSNADLRAARLAAAKLQTSRDSEALVARGNLAMIDGDPKQAVTLMTDAVAADPSDAYAHHQLGFALNEAGKSEESLTHLKQALGLAPKMEWVQRNLANVLAKLGRCDERIEGLVPEATATCHDEVGAAAYNAGKAAEARRHFERAVQLAGNVGGFHANLAISLLATGDRQGAYQHAMQARKLGVKEHPVFEPLGIR